jgi:hypothetical protein
MEATMVIPESAEWHFMWGMLAVHHLNVDNVKPTLCLCPETNEGWQYMGTYEGRHEFRHRYHPVTQQREYIAVPVSPSYK